MEVLIGNREVLLTTHKTYRDDGEGGVRSVAAYTPFCNYLAACAEHGPMPSAFIVRNIRRIAQRVVGVIMDVECETQSGKVVQTVDLCDSTPVVLLPIAIVNDTKYALLVRQRRVSAGCKFTVEAFCGAEDCDGTITWTNGELLTRLGFDLNSVEVLSQVKYTVGNEGTAPYKVCSASVLMAPEIFQGVQESAKGAETSFIAVPLEEVMFAVSDAKAGLAASLVLAEPLE
ncbi:hypothetical protein DQ04_00591110 [Trypanosoma grayi]|uniref:hypothetical protein n=1 Tax=Trypanosoma grayi TaxID=71804 RepID=UPI0004F3F9D3|nr:hypothetical protein DQ04_00591110 [Trypanosoma grayi]KEG14170.1 hypothetical protein DQ04_00591110 [Trypanosoma grayi]